MDYLTLLQMYGPDPNGWHWWPMFPFFFMCVFFFFVFLFFFRRKPDWGPRGGQIGEDSGKSYESAQEILKKRYAKGEISKEEYEEMRKVLSK